MKRGPYAVALFPKSMESMLPFPFCYGSTNLATDLKKIGVSESLVGVRTFRVHIPLRAQVLGLKTCPAGLKSRNVFRGSTTPLTYAILTAML